jgi:hypothetical protein
MFFHMAIHKHHPEAEAALIDSMRRFGEAMQKCDGLVNVFQLKDTKTGHLVGLAIWESKAHWEAAMPVCRPVIANDPFDDWEDEPPQTYEFEEV